MVNEQFDDMLAKLKNVRDRYECELEVAPEGKLYCSRDQYGVRYYRSWTEGGRSKREGITKKKSILNALARKEYLKQAIRILDRNISTLEKARTKYIPCDPDDIAGNLSASYKQLPQEAFFDSTVDISTVFLDREISAKIASHAAWGNEEYRISNYKPEGRNLLTSRGERMRSKAEVLIAEKLYEYCIPFRYEQELDLGGAVVHPDFTFEGAGGELFFLEFCGMMDDDAYVRNFLRKRAIYEAAGIYEWKNIIYVFASGNEMNMMHIDSVIINQVIPWL